MEYNSGSNHGVILDEREADLKLWALYSTLNKITQFWLVESCTINPKLYSVGVPIKFPWKRRNFVECTINKNHTIFSYNSWIIGTSDFENFQNHSYLLITNCTRGRAISYTNYLAFKLNGKFSTNILVSKYVCVLISVLKHHWFILAQRLTEKKAKKNN